VFDGMEAADFLEKERTDLILLDVMLPKLDGFERKLERVKAFYERGLNQVGWNKYSRINVEFSNQIICTKREN